ncbi:MAG: TolC family outer membrane protein [Pseudomonadales bacterium]|nr:TolC family outer membrane protein [Pseudomonadales bacterium]
MHSFFTMLQLFLFVLMYSALSHANTDSEDLSSVFQHALKNDFQWASKVHAYNANKEAKALGASGIKPTVKLNAQTSQDSYDSDTFGNDSYSSTSYGATLVQPIFRLDKWRDYQKGRALERQADAEFQYEQQAFYLRVADVYFDVLRAEENLTFRKAEKSAIKSQMEQIQYRFKAGLAADTDVQEAKAAFDLITVQHIIAQQELDFSLENLHTLTGVTLSRVTPLKSIIPINAPSPASMKEWTNTALAYNPVLRAARYAKQAAQRNYQVKTSAHLPTLDLVGNYRDTDRYIQTSEGELSSTSISLKLEIPLYSGGAISASRRQAKELYLQASEEFNFKNRELLQNTRNLYRLVSTDISRVHAQKQGIRSMDAALTAIEAGYSSGTRTILDVLNAQNTLYSAKRDYANARFDYILDSLRLKQVAGILSDEELLNINNWLGEKETP